MTPLTILVQLIVFAGAAFLLLLGIRTVYVHLSRRPTRCEDGTVIYYHRWCPNAYWLSEPIEGSTPEERLERHRYLLEQARRARAYELAFRRWEARRFGGPREAGKVVRAVVGGILGRSRG
jgi:hypothetical protein